MTTETEIVLATRSADKIREIREILAHTRGLTLLTLADVGVDLAAEEEHIEAFATFAGNALAKATYFLQRTGRAVVADDSGICVEALRGAPGVHSKRFAKDSGLAGLALDRANNCLLLERLQGRPAAQRGARYICVAALARPERAPAFAVGSVRGIVIENERGDDGFGYDPLFLLPELQRTFAEIDQATKHQLSHRGRAFRALLPLLR